MVECHYEVNVATAYGAHYCKIILPSMLTKSEAVERTRVIARSFGTDFKATLTYIECFGRPIEV